MAILVDNYELMNANTNIRINVLHLHWLSKAFVSNLYSTPSQGVLWQCRLGFDHETFAIPNPPCACTQLIPAARIE